ncbi:MAG: hypothetical protein OXJ62_12665, partial [Spirochaetaceae bacterium]|nr:hypothetical protein [Spirochaetaceae bacterium]
GGGVHVKLAEHPADLDLSSRGNLRLVLEEQHLVREQGRANLLIRRGIEAVREIDAPDFGAQRGRVAPDVERRPGAISGCSCVE